MDKANFLIHADPCNPWSLQDFLTTDNTDFTDGVARESRCRRNTKSSHNLDCFFEFFAPQTVKVSTGCVHFLTANGRKLTLMPERQSALAPAISRPLASIRGSSFLVAAKGRATFFAVKKIKSNRKDRRERKMEPFCGRPGPDNCWDLYNRRFSKRRSVR